MRINKLLKINTLFFVFIISLISVFSIQTCFVSNAGLNICHQSDTGIYPQNINLWEGHNSKYGVNIINVNDEAIGITGRIDVTQLGDNTIFEFQSIDDFYNLVQQSNAKGNITLFTQAELNQETRERTTLLISEVLGANTMLFIIIIEMFKIFISVAFILSVLYAFFRLIPLVLKNINLILFKIAVGRIKK